MQIDIEVNNQTLSARKGETILEALAGEGIQIPTLCRLEDFTPTGACRLCVVEVEGRDHLVPACSYPVEEWMKIRTHSPRVIEARKMIVELLLSNHPDDCLYCERNGHCELQRLAEELNIRERRLSGRKSRTNLDLSSPGIVYDPSKCVLCSRCVRICEENQQVSTLDFTGRGNTTAVSAAMGKDLNFSNCIQCGQCIMVCPTGALHDKSYLDAIQQAVNREDMTTVVHYAPSVAVSLAEELGMKPGKDMSGLINRALKKIGFDKVYDGTFASEIYVMEEAAELADRIDKGDALPVISSSCPAWVKEAEQKYPDLLPHLSTVKSPEQIAGSIIKRYCLESSDRGQNDIFSVAISPCPAKKFEAQRQEMTHQGISDIDAVMTTRELARLIKLYGVDMHAIEPAAADQPFNKDRSAARLTASLGGTNEAILRTLYYKITGKDLKNPRISKMRGARNTKYFSFQMENQDLNFAALSPLGDIRELMEDMRNEQVTHHYVEVMACKGGCINGGGQPFHHSSQTVRSRMKAIHNQEDKMDTRFIHHSPEVKRFYSDYLDHPNGEEARKLLHTRFSARDVLL
ncbi:MAG: (2Fe-2S)-binding protein [Bacteroidales bacterium]|nr:(2Fe-2S)-binding protein [Bacteroidales bacterium]